MPLEHKESEKFVNQSEEKFKMILENTNDLITIINEEFRHEYINEKTYFNLLGYKEEDIIGKKPLIPLHPDDIKIAEKTFRKTERFGKDLEVETEGSGLGLYISKEIIELHKGKILVKSQGRNKGSTFTIKLPK